MSSAARTSSSSASEKTHIAPGPWTASCEKGLSVGSTAAALSRAMEARDEKRLRLQKQQIQAGHRRTGFVPSVKPATWCSRCSASIERRHSASNLPFDSKIFGSDVLDRRIALTHHVHILEMNGGEPKPKMATPSLLDRQRLLTRWAHRRCFAPRTAKRYAKQLRVLWTNQQAYRITENASFTPTFGPILLRR